MNGCGQTPWKRRPRTIGDELDEAQAFFEERLEGYLDQPEDEQVYASFEEAKQRFYKDARWSLDRARVNRGFYPSDKGKGKDRAGRPGQGRGQSSGSGSGRGTFNGRCMRCGRYGRKAMDCKQGSRDRDRPPDGGNTANKVGFVFVNMETRVEKIDKQYEIESPVPADKEQSVKINKQDEIASPVPFDKKQSGKINKQDEIVSPIPAYVMTTSNGESGMDYEEAYAVLRGKSEHKAILDSGASESIVGAHTLQGLYDHYSSLGFDADKEVTVDHQVNRSFVFGNDQTSAALGLAKVNAGICGQEQRLDIHVVEGATPLLLSGRWLYDVGAVLNFRTGRACFTEISKAEVQLERAPAFHLMMPVNAFGGNEDVLSGLFVKGSPADEGIASTQTTQRFLPAQPHWILLLAWPSSFL